MARRKLRRNRNKKQVRLVLGVAICLLCVMTVGYAAFSTNISLNAKGNITSMPTAAEFLKAKLGTCNQGELVEDSTLEGRYIYRGADPCNYITFNDVKDGTAGWRILSIETDGTIKIIKNDSFGEEDYWGSTVWENSLAYSILNDQTNPNSFYSSGLSDEAKSLMTSHDFNVGKVAESLSDLSDIKAAEASSKWHGNVGLMIMSDFLQINPDTTNCGSKALYNTNTSNCYSNNFIINQFWDPNKTYFTMWFMTTGINYDAWTLDSDASLMPPFLISEPTDDYYGTFMPVVYLDSALKIKGSGTSSDPYTITKVN